VYALPPRARKRHGPPANERCRPGRERTRAFGPAGNGFPRDGTDGEWKIAGRDAILTMKDGVLELATAAGDETLPSGDIATPYFTAVRDALDHWRRGPGAGGPGDVIVVGAGIVHDMPYGVTRVVRLSGRRQAMPNESFRKETAGGGRARPPPRGATRARRRR